MVRPLAGLSPTKPAASKPLSTSAVIRACELLRIASNPDRLELLRLLEGGSRNVSELLKEFPGVTDQFVSRHLGFLRAGGLVDNRTEGVFRVYSLTDRGRRLMSVLGGLRVE